MHIGFYVAEQTSLNVFIDPILHLHLCIFINTHTHSLYHMCTECSREWHNGSNSRPHRIRSCFTHRCSKLYTFMHSSLDNDIELSVKRSCIEHFTFKILRKREREKNKFCASYIPQKTHKHSFIFIRGLCAQVRIY